MDFAPAPRPRSPRESIVPMINVAFLLLIFFLMSAQIAPPDPVAVTPPDVGLADAPPPNASHILWLTPDGRLLNAEARAPDMTTLAMQIILRADADAPAADLARVLRELASAGVAEVTLVARQGGG